MKRLNRTWRLLVDEGKTGAMNMALDEAIATFQLALEVAPNDAGVQQSLKETQALLDRTH